MQRARRLFVQSAAGLIATALTGSWVTAHPRANARRRRIFSVYRWSGKGRRVSRAALAHAANRRYLTMRAGLRDQPHPASHLRLVRLDASLSEIFRLFISRRRLVADLRRLG